MCTKCEKHLLNFDRSKFANSNKFYSNWYIKLKVVENIQSVPNPITSSTNEAGVESAMSIIHITVLYSSVLACHGYL